MRDLILAGFLAGSLAVLGPAPVLAQSAQTTPPPPPPPPASNGQLQSPERAGTSNVVHAAEAPLHDLNLSRQEIPPILLRAIDNPYRRPPSLTCAGLKGQVMDLTTALGADFDQSLPQDANPNGKRDRTALALVHSGAESLLPFSGFVRTLSGARKHDQLVIEAITAGSTRRGYIKGLAEARRCLPPAAPNHGVPARGPVQDSAPKPHYPTH